MVRQDGMVKVLRVCMSPGVDVTAEVDNGVVGWVVQCSEMVSQVLEVNSLSKIWTSVVSKGIQFKPQATVYKKDST